MIREVPQVTPAPSTTPLWDVVAAARILVDVENEYHTTSGSVRVAMRRLEEALKRLGGDDLALAIGPLPARRGAGHRSWNWTLIGAWTLMLVVGVAVWVVAWLSVDAIARAVVEAVR